MSEINLYNLSLDELKEQARILGIVVRGNPGADTLRAVSYTHLTLPTKA